MSDSRKQIPEPPVSDAEWLDRIRDELGTRDPAEALLWSLPDGFSMPAVRGPEDVSGTRPPVPMRAGGKPWEVRLDVETAAQLDLARAFGADAVNLVMPELWGDPLAKHLVAGARGTAIVDALLHDGTLPPGGTLDLDVFAESGEVVERLFDWAASVLPATTAIGYRVACADGMRVHLAGASDTTELAAILASVAAWLDGLVSERGVDPLAAVSALHVRTSASPLFFPTVARLRALRLGLFAVTRAYGAPREAARGIPVHVVTSPRLQTGFDPWGNLLRATTAATAAVIGGCDALTVTPHDRHAGRTDRGRRLALTLQAILRDEGRLHLASDPSCGSWYVESLTDRMGLEAWSLFQEIRVSGETDLMRRARDEGRTQEEAISRRERVMVGVNRYADPGETPPATGAPGERMARPSARIESLRAAMHPESAHGHEHPPALILAFGDRSHCSRRATFVADFLGCAGIRVEGPVRVESEDAMATAVQQASNPMIVLCGSEEVFASYGAAARRGLQLRHGDATLIGVGRPPADNPASWNVDSAVDETTPLVAGIGRILGAAGLRFESER